MGEFGCDLFGSQWRQMAGFCEHGNEPSSSKNWEQFLNYLRLLVGRVAHSVGVATDYGLDGPGIESRWGEIFHPSRLALGPTQPPVQRVPSLSRG